MGYIKQQYIERFGEEAWEKERLRQKEYRKKYYQNNKEELTKYYKEYRKNNPDKISKRQKKYREEKGEEYAEYARQYRKTMLGRAKTILQAYIKKDIKYNRGECTLTPEWIVDNIFNSSCIYCGDSDWTHLGADRIDNSKPHTPDNCVCACGLCNIERQDNYSVEEFKKYRQLHPRILKDQKSWEIVEQNGNKVIKKRTNF